MDEQRIKQLLPFIGSKLAHNASTGWVGGKCPYALWRHDKGVDNNPSFAISIKDQELSRYHCFSCNSSGDLMDMMIELQLEITKDPDSSIYYDLGEALKLVLVEEEEAEFNIPDYEDDTAKNVEKVIPWNEAYAESFKSVANFPEALKYLKTRQINDKIIKRLDLRYDPIKKTVVFPIRNWDGDLVGMRGRYIKPTKNSPRYHAYTHKNLKNKLAWIGEDTVDSEVTVVIVESVFDMASVMRLYPNVIGALSSGLSAKKIQRIAHFTDVITLFDWGKGGDGARAKLDKYMMGTAITHILLTEDQGDAGNLTEGDVANILGEALDNEFY